MVVVSVATDVTDVVASTVAIPPAVTVGLLLLFLTAAISAVSATIVAVSVSPLFASVVAVFWLLFLL